MYTTQTQVRSAFWAEHPQFDSFYRKSKRQNDYPTDVRVAFVDFVDYLERSGMISLSLAGRVTL